MLEYLHNPVSSTKIETILSSHPDLIEVCVVGVRVPIYYDIPTAVVVKGADSKLTAEDIHLWIKGKVNSVEMISIFDILTENYICRQTAQ